VIIDFQKTRLGFDFSSSYVPKLLQQRFVNLTHLLVGRSGLNRGTLGLSPVEVVTA